MERNLLETFARKYRLDGNGRGFLPQSAKELDAFKRTIMAWPGVLRLARLTEDQRRELKQPLPPELREIAEFYAELFRKRPELAKRLGISAEMMELLLHREVDSSTLIELARELVRVASDAGLLIAEALKEANQKIADSAERLSKDESLPLSRRQYIKANFKIQKRDRALKALSDDRKEQKAQGRLKAQKKRQEQAEAALRTAKALEKAKKKT
jgi:hypothetical protein